MKIGKIQNGVSHLNQAAKLLTLGRSRHKKTILFLVLIGLGTLAFELSNPVSMPEQFFTYRQPSDYPLRTQDVTRPLGTYPPGHLASIIHTPDI